MDINIETVGIVVPTLGNRPELLAITLKSIKQSKNVFTLIVSPESTDLSTFSGLYDQQIKDPGTGLANAINAGFAALPGEINLINWLGDDDFLEPSSIDIVRSVLLSDTKIVGVFGQCVYVNQIGKEIFTNRSGQWAVPLLRFGPDLVPQPGMLFKRDAFNSVGGLSSEFGWAFDFDLLLKLSRIGQLKYVNHKVAYFRWHPDSLSVGQRSNSVKEASKVRVSHLPRFLKPISLFWEKPIMHLTQITGEKLSKRLLREKSIE